MHTDESHSQAITSVLRVALRDIGWIQGRDIQVVERFGAGKIERVQAYAGELVALGPDVIFALASAQLAAVSRETQTIPIVFVGASDPVGAGICDCGARPGAWGRTYHRTRNVY